MATKLKDLKIKKTDFVDAGANQRADILLTKRNEGNRDNNPAESDEFSKGLINSITSAISKYLKKDSIKKEAVSFEERMEGVDLDRVCDEIWSVCYALQGSLVSILRDDEETNKAGKMQESVDQFCNMVPALIQCWETGKIAAIQKNLEPSEEDLPMLEQMQKSIYELINKAHSQEGEEEEMRIDKSKMTPEEKATYESLVEKYKVEDPEDVGKKAPATKPDPDDEIDEEDEGKKAATKKFKDPDPQEPGSNEDVYKGLHPAVAAEIQSLRKYREEQELRELRAVAKKYEILGKKPDEFAAVLKSLKDAGGSAYDDMIATMDSMISAMDASGVFSEIGKSGGREISSSIAKSSAEAKVEGIAKGLMNDNPELSPAAALAKAWEAHPELWDEYEDEAGF